MRGYSAFSYLTEVTFGRPITDIQGTLKTVALPFAIACLVTRATLSVWMNRTHRRPPGFSPMAASIMSASVLMVAYFGGNSLAGDHGKLPAAYITSATILLFAPTLVVLTPLLTMYLVSAVRHRTLASPPLLVAATCACLILQTLWFNSWAGAK